MIQVLEVTKEDNPIGLCEKMDAHEKGALHRAFSVLIYNSRGDMLLQKRADCKYHSPGKWTNAACGHPVDSSQLTVDSVKAEAKKRLFEEMGIEGALEFSHKFHYEAKVEDLWENEIDYVFIGTYDGEVHPNPAEVSDYKWMPMPELLQDIEANSDSYTPWFRIIAFSI